MVDAIDPTTFGAQWTCDVSFFAHMQRGRLLEVDHADQVQNHRRPHWTIPLQYQVHPCHPPTLLRQLFRLPWWRNPKQGTTDWLQYSRPRVSCPLFPSLGNAWAKCPVLNGLMLLSCRSNQDRVANVKATFRSGNTIGPILVQCTSQVPQKNKGIGDQRCWGWLE